MQINMQDVQEKAKAVTDIVERGYRNTIWFAQRARSSLTGFDFIKTNIERFLQNPEDTFNQECLLDAAKRIAVDANKRSSGFASNTALYTGFKEAISESLTRLNLNLGGIDCHKVIGGIQSGSSDMSGYGRSEAYREKYPEATTDAIRTMLHRDGFTREVLDQLKGLVEDYAERNNIRLG